MNSRYFSLILVTWSLIISLQFSYFVISSPYITKVQGQEEVSNRDMWVYKNSIEGNTQWQIKFGGMQEDAAYDIIETTDGGLVMVGFTDSYGNGNSDVFVVRINDNGQLIWQETYVRTKNFNLCSQMIEFIDRYINNMTIMFIHTPNEVFWKANQTLLDQDIQNQKKFLSYTDAIIGEMSEWLNATFIGTFETQFHRFKPQIISK